MSVQVTNVEWSLLGVHESTLAGGAGYLRLFSSTASAGHLSYTENSIFKVRSFLVSPFSSQEQTSIAIPFSGNAPAYSVNNLGRFFVFNHNGKVCYSDFFGNFSTLQQNRSAGFGQSEISIFPSLDGTNQNNGLIAWSFEEKYNAYNFKGFIWGSPYQSELTFSSLVDTGFTGLASLSRNGIFCCLLGVSNNTKVLKVYTPQGGFFPNSGNFVSVQVGVDLNIPNALGVRINNSGNKLFAYTSQSVSCYELVSANWTLKSTITLPQGVIGGAKINDDGSVLILSTNSGLYTYTPQGTVWLQSGSVSGVIGSEANSGGNFDISGNSAFLAAEFIETNARVFKFYKSTISQVTYDAPVITPGQSFTLAENTAFSGAVAMLSDGLNRTVTSWSATGLPAGLSINAATGQITGTPTAKGQYTASITATNPDGSDTESVLFIVQVAIPIFAGAIRATAVYAGAAAAKAIYYGAKKLWPPPQHHEILESLGTINPADGSRGHSKFLDTGLNLAASNLSRIGFKFAGGVRIKNATITTTAGTYTLGAATNWTLVKYFTSHDLTITADGIGRSGGGNLGNGWGADVCGFWVEIPASSLTASEKITVDYEYIGAYAAKHGVAFWNATTTAGGTVESYMGTWDNTPLVRMPTTAELPRIIVTAQASLISNTLCRRRVIIQNNP